MPGAVFLEGEKVNLRTIEEEDIEFLTNVNKPEIRKNLSSIPTPHNTKQQRAFFENAICSEDEAHLAICKEKQMIGIISLIPKENGETAKIGLWIDTEYHGNGYGTEASRIITEYAFEQLRYRKVYARAFETNKASQNVWEKLGFEKEGELREQVFRNGKYEDVHMYGIVEHEWKT